MSYRQTTVKLPKYLWERVYEVIQRENVSFTAFVRGAIKYCLDNISTCIEYVRREPSIKTKKVEEEWSIEKILGVADVI